MFEKLGGLFGWLLVIAFAGTILNYCLKFINKRYSKKIAQYPNGKRIIKMLMTIFVRNHKYFGLATIVLLLAHFISQFTRFGINVTGAIAAVLMVIQVLLGMYANIKKRPRKGLWFFAHRVIAVLIIFGIGYHLLAPNALNATSGKNNYNVSVDTSNLQAYTLTELAQYNGQNGNKAYVAYQGLVYDVTNVPQWKNGTHNGQKAGTDLTDALSKAPHGSSVLKGLTVVGKIG